MGMPRGKTGQEGQKGQKGQKGEDGEDGPKGRGRADGRAQAGEEDGRRARDVSRARWVLVPAVLVSGVLASGCSVATDDLPRPGLCVPFTMTDVSPADGATGVLPSVIPTLTFSDFPDPDSATGQNLSINSGVFFFTLSESVDLIDRQVLFQPTSTLPIGVGFTMAVYSGLRSLRGCPLAPPPADADGRRPSVYAFSFRTLDPGQPVPPPPALPAPATFDQVMGVFGGHCAGAACHLAAGADPSDPTACLSSPAAALSLCARDAAASLIGVPAQEVATLVRVAPQDSARSYLLRKLLGAPPFSGHTAPRADTLTHDELTVIASWIDAGALPAAPTAETPAAQASVAGQRRD